MWNLPLIRQGWLFPCRNFVLVLAGCAFLLPGQSLAAITLTFEAVGADVRATISGTITADFGTPTAGGYITKNGYFYSHAGGGIQEVRYAYGTSSTHDYYSLSSASLLTSPSTPSFQNVPPRDNGSVLPGGTPTAVLLTMDFGSTPRIHLYTSPGATSFNSTVVWAGSSLGQFFASADWGKSYQLVKASDSSTPLVTLNIVPEPSTFSLLMVSLAGLTLILRRKHA